MVLAGLEVCFFRRQLDTSTWAVLDLVLSASSNTGGQSREVDTLFWDTWCVDAVSTVSPSPDSFDCSTERLRKRYHGRSRGKGQANMLVLHPQHPGHGGRQERTSREKRAPLPDLFIHVVYPAPHMQHDFTLLCPRIQSRHTRSSTSSFAQ